jgi:hypothetical protein
MSYKRLDGRGARIRTGGLLRPRQARYQAALRPDRLCVLIIRDFATRMLSNGPIRPSCCARIHGNSFA